MKNLYIFDIDDTLIDTTACVRVIDEQGHIKYRLGTRAHNARSNTSNLLFPKLKFDYTEFRSLAQLHSEPKRQVFNILKQHARIHPTDVYIITAREDSNLIHTWLNESGVKIPIDNIYTNEFTKQTLGEWKRNKLLQIVEQVRKFPNEFVTAHIWEDDEDCQFQMKKEESYNLHVILEDIF